MAPALRTGVRLFVLTTPAAVAVLAVATDTPAVMVLIAVPGAVVGGVLYQEHRRTTDQPTAAGTVPRSPGRPDTRRLIIIGPGTPTMDDATSNRVQAPPLPRTVGRTDGDTSTRCARTSNGSATSTPS